MERNIASFTFGMTTAALLIFIYEILNFSGGIDSSKANLIDQFVDKTIRVECFRSVKDLIPVKNMAARVRTIYSTHDQSDTTLDITVNSGDRVLNVPFFIRKSSPRDKFNGRNLFGYDQIEDGKFIYVDGFISVGTYKCPPRFKNQFFVLADRIRSER